VIRYDPFWETLKLKKVTSYALIRKHNIGNGTLYRMRKNAPLSTRTINDLCDILDCRVEDIMIYVKDKDKEK
jgi:putative transcriptional regulator